MPDWQDGAIVPVTYPLMLEPIERAVYLDHREPFNFASLLMSPMMLMVGFSIVMVVVMPYLTRQLGAYSSSLCGVVRRAHRRYRA